MLGVLRICGGDRGFARTVAECWPRSRAAWRRPGGLQGRRRPLWAPFAVLGGSVAFRSLIRYARCDHSPRISEVDGAQSPWLISSKTRFDFETYELEKNRLFIVRWTTWVWRSAVWTICVTIRLISLCVRFVPLLVTYPMVSWNDRARTKWWDVALWTVQSSGPTLIKLGQWASTRRDLFSKEFCDKLSVLHTRTRSRQWHLSRSSLDELFGGPEWNSFLVAVQSEPVGSGCIAQVYGGKLNIDAFQQATGIQVPNHKGQRFMNVAIKVANAGVRERIELDLSIMRGAVRLMQLVVPNLFLVDPVSCLNQFEAVLKRQVDLRNEAKALQRFSRNFDVKKTGVRFPVVLCYSKDVIIESFEEGTYVNRLITGDDEVLARQSASVKRRVALLGARAILKMIFVDNFVHGDLHPGNILISFNENHEGKEDVHRAPQPESPLARAWDSVKEALNWTHEPRIRITESSEFGDEPTLVILDTGIAIEETPQNLRNLRALFSAVVETRGYDVGKLLLSHAPQHRCADPEKFCREVEEIVRVARSSCNLRKLNISQLLSKLFSIVSEHQVSLETSFTTVVLSVMVLEGLGRSLDPELDLFQCARPYLLSVIY